MGFYEFMRECEAENMTEAEALNEWAKYCEDQKEAFLDAYYNDPVVDYGARQGDLIDLYRMER